MVKNDVKLIERPPRGIRVGGGRERKKIQSGPRDLEEREVSGCQKKKRKLEEKGNKMQAREVGGVRTKGRNWRGSVLVERKYIRGVLRDSIKQNGDRNRRDGRRKRSRGD